MAETNDAPAKIGPRTGLWQFCTKYAKRANAEKKRLQHLKNLAARGTGRKPT